ncbi:hypothetical protein EV426DRAFT_713373 [Tirmania nivea]|nr:hypothetical protein EV426DRAFT_713373 [Tirmania nivea]
MLIESQLEGDSFSKESDHGKAPKTKLQEYTLTEAKDPLEDQTLDSMDSGMFPLGQDSEPDLIFAEILEIIKGSTSVQRRFEPLPEEEYIGLSQKKAPVFTSSESRAYVYRIYEDYERKKRLLGDRDDIRRAEHSQGVELATAYLLYEEASALDVEGEDKSAAPIYRQAAQQFEGAGFIKKAAESWGSAGDYIKAAKLLQAHAEYGKAATWYEKAGKLLDAASSYQQAAMYDDAVRAYRTGEHFAELIIFMKTYQDNISKDVRVRYSTLVNLLLQRDDLQRLCLRPSVFWVKEQGRFDDAFKLAISKGKLEDALHVLAHSAIMAICQSVDPLTKGRYLQLGGTAQQW